MALAVWRRYWSKIGLRSVGGADAVAEPLVSAFVNDDEVKSRADADACPVAFEVAVSEAVAVGDCALMLHAGVGCFDQLVAIFLERIVAEIVLKRLKHPASLRELFFCLVEIFGHRVEVERQVAEPVGEVYISADVQRDI